MSFSFPQITKYNNSLHTGHNAGLVIISVKDNEETKKKQDNKIKQNKTKKMKHESGEILDINHTSYKEYLANSKVIKDTQEEGSSVQII